MGCKLTIEEARERKAHYAAENRRIDEHLAKNKIPKMDKKYVEAVQQDLHYQATGQRHRPPQTIEEMKKYKIAVNSFLKYLKKERSDLWYWFGNPDRLLGDNPATKIFGEKVFESVNHFKGITQEFDTHMNDFMFSMREGAFQLGADKPLGYSLKRVAGANKISAEKNLTMILNKYNEAIQNQNWKDAKYLYQRKGGIYDMLTSGEAKVFKQVHELLISSSDPKSPNYYRKVSERNNYNQHIINAADVYHTRIQPKARKEMVKGLESFRNNLQDKRHLFKNFVDKKGNSLYDKTLDSLNNIIKSYNSGELQKDGYFPVLSMDVLPSLAAASKHIHHGKNKAEIKKGLNVVSNLENILNSNLAQNTHLKEKVEKFTRGGENLKNVSSMNVIPIVDSYVRNAARFNLVAFNTGEFIKVTSAIESMRGGNLDVKLEKLQDYVNHMYSTVSGAKARENQTSSEIARAITSWQFASKLGLNVRSAARNSTQSLLNFVWFGPVAMWKAHDFGQSAEMINRVNNGLEANGILFPNFRDVYMDEFMPTSRYNDKTGTYREVMDPSWGRRLGDALENYSQKSGWGMQVIENNLNRKWTYKIAYNLAWKGDKEIKGQLENSFQRNVLKKWLQKDKYTENEIAEFKKDNWAKLKSEKSEKFGNIKNVNSKFDAYFETYRRNRANRAGTWAVKELHYDYSPTGKAKILTTPLGGTLGQFQHYSWSFFNFQVKIAQKARDSVMADMWQDPNVFRMYRLGMLYGAITPVLSLATNWNFANLVQNDTYDRFTAMRDAIMGEPEEKKRAFYGKGPVIGLAGGPTVSDMITLGNVMNLYDMDEDSWSAYLSGYQDHGDLANNEKGMEILRLISTQGHRTTTSVKQLYKGQSAGSLFQKEFAGFPSPEMTYWRRKIGLEQVPESKTYNKRIKRTPIDTLDYIADGSK